MWESPIEKIYGDIHAEMVKQDEEHFMYSVNQTIGYQVDKDELIKALSYDRDQYNKGYQDALQEYYDAITDINFLKYNYGIHDIDQQFIRSFNPISIINDHREYRNYDRAERTDSTD